MFGITQSAALECSIILFRDERVKIRVDVRCDSLPWTDPFNVFQRFTQLLSNMADNLKLQWPGCLSQNYNEKRLQFTIGHYSNIVMAKKLFF